ITDAVHVFRPVSAKIEPLDERDVLPAGPKDPGDTHWFGLYQEYTIDVEEEFKAAVWSSESLSGAYVDLAGGLTQVFGENGSLVWQGSRGTITFPKGKNRVFRLFRALDVSKLEAIRDTPLVLGESLSSKPSFKIYDRPEKVLAGS